MTGPQVRRLAYQAGRLLLLGAVVFWWGGVVLPRLISFSFPELLPSSAIPWHLNPDKEGSAANAVSAAALSTAALLAFGAAVVSARRSAGRVTVGGWAALAATAAYLAWEEVSEFHVARTLALGGEVLGMKNSQYLWPVLLSPLIVAFFVAMWLFVRRGLPARAVREPLILGLAAWGLAVGFVASFLSLFRGRAEELEPLLEETLEFSGTLLIAASAVGAVRGAVERVLSGRCALALISGSAAAVMVFGGLALAFAFRAPLVDARIESRVGTFAVSLHDGVSLAQEIGALAAPLARLDLRIGNRDPHGRSGILIWRISEPGEGGSGHVLREGRMVAPAKDHPSWESIDFPPLAQADGRPVTVQLVAEVERGAHIRIGATKTNMYKDGRLWVNGELAWPDQNLEFVAYGATEPTRSKLGAMWNVLTSDWRWPALAATLTSALMLTALIPAVLLAAVLWRAESRAAH